MAKKFLLTEFDVNAGIHGQGRLRLMVATDLQPIDWPDLIKSLLAQMPQAISQVDYTTIKELKPNDTK